MSGRVGGGWGCVACRSLLAVRSFQLRAQFEDPITPPLASPSHRYLNLRFVVSAFPATMLQGSVDSLVAVIVTNNANVVAEPFCKDPMMELW